jgi:hypothetical protein
MCGDPAKITNATGWKATTPIERSLADIMNYWDAKVTMHA